MKEPQLPTISPPPNPPETPKPRFLIIGAGSRGTAYARAVTTATPGTVHAVAEPHPFKRRELGQNFIWGEQAPVEGQEFVDWRDWLAWEVKRRETGSGRGIGVDGVFICTLDETHVEIVQAIAPLNLHILCEKPLALSLSDCLSVYRALTPNNAPPSTIFSIGHVLRYSPHNILLRNLLNDRVIGDIISLEHTEPVGWWHFSHSYVRGNWRRETKDGDGSLLTKSCHDIDFILWLLSSPTDAAARMGEGYHHPRSITSTGSCTQFTPRRKPRAAGSATNCLSCPVERECNYSALKIYRDMHLSRGERGWPVNIVCPDIEDIYRSSGPEAAHTRLLSRLGEDYNNETPDSEIASKQWYGRCVYSSDNSVCDDQIVTLTWSESLSPTQNKPPKTALFHMISPTEKQCERRGRIYGTTGEISYDSRSITIYNFSTQSSTTIDVPKPPPDQQESHGGGDYGLARSFVRAVEAVGRGEGVKEAQARFVGCSLEEAVRSHAVVFAAEEARREEKVVMWKEWWEGKLAGAGIQRLE